MPIDPLIANGVAPVKFNDPMEQYGNYLKNAYLKSEITKTKQGQDDIDAQNNAFSDPGSRNADNSLNWEGVTNNLIKGKHGRLAPALLLDKQKIDTEQSTGYKARQEGNKASADAVAKDWENAQTQYSNLSADDKLGPLQGLQLIKHNYASSTLGPWLRDRGQTPEQDAVNQQQAIDSVGWLRHRANLMLGVKNAAEQNINAVKAGNINLLQATPKYSVNPGGPVATNVPGSGVDEGMSPDQRAQLGIKGQELTLAQKTQSDANRIAQGGLDLKKLEADPTYQLAKAGNANLATKTGDTFITQHIAASKYPQAIRHIDDTLDLLNSGSAFTGAAQSKLLYLNKLLAFAHMEPVSDPSVVNTELLNKNLNKIIVEQLQDGPTSLRTTNMLTGLTRDSSASTLLDPATIRSVLMSKRQDIQEQNKYHIGMTNQLLNSQMGQGLKGLGFVPTTDIPAYTNDIPQDKIEHLRQLPNVTPATMSAFDKAFGRPGAAEAILSTRGTPTGAGPLVQVGQ